MSFLRILGLGLEFARFFGDVFRSVTVGDDFTNFIDCDGGKRDSYNFV